MYCSNCGKEINETAKFCSNCGMKQNNIETEAKSITEKIEIEKCGKCNQEKRNIYIGIEFTGNRVCPNCEIISGVCPNCHSQLRTYTAQQCKDCKASWRELPPSLESYPKKISSIKSVETDSTNEIKCPNCKSKSITANKKGFGLGKAIVGGILTGGVGLLGGFIGSNEIKLTCLNCGNVWKPAKK